ncbi:calcium-binding protein [Leptolyngbya sp. O-77]|uniref:calcium-binding protein n=1 Tax=Leptolyngbya sp. O-77 TaxID=1080068 RepID=UPI00074D35AE|nr:hypothetical protein [Leptolyngbya sp. O-77]BAU43277.1 Bifunctional hemolysin/adenylate cyclase precursor [Leptolyngbya sp. O-77]
MTRQIFDRESNNQRSQAVNAGNANGGFFVRDGNLNSNDKRDFYQFQVDRPTQVDLTLQAKPFLGRVNAALLLQDNNGNLLTFANSINNRAQLFMPNLPAGTYFLEVLNDGLESYSYDLSASGATVTNAQISVTVDRIRAIDKFDFTPGDRADFYIEEIFIGNQLTGRSRVFWDQDDVRPNYTVARSVDINSIDDFTHNVGIDVRDDDPPFPRSFHDRADIDGTRGRFAGGIYDRRTNMFRNGEQTFVENGRSLTETGDGFAIGTRLKRASIEYRVTYSAFTSSSTFNQLNRSSTLTGDNRSNTIVGNNRNGILDGGGGSDSLSGMGGNDVLCGNNGNDTLYGGTGRDMLWGGRGNDTYYGGAGRDTFVLDLLRGVDVIKDFKDGTDKIGLTNGIVYELLDIKKEGKHSGIFLGDQKLGVVENTRPRDLTADDFQSISFVTIKDILTPQVMA